MTGVVRVLFVSTSFVALPTSVSVAAGSVSVPDAAAVGTKAVVPEEEPVKVTPCVPAITPVVSATVTTLFCITFPVVLSKRAMALSTEEAGPETSPPPDGAANVPSPRRKVVVLFGGVGTPPPTVAVIVATLPVAIGVLKVWTPVNVLAASVLAIAAEVVGNV